MNDELETESIPYKITMITEGLEGDTISIKVTEATKDAILKGCETNADSGVFMDWDRDSFYINFTKLIFLGTEKFKEKPKTRIPSEIMHGIVNDILNKDNQGGKY